MIRRSIADRIADLTGYIILILLCVVSLYPMLYVFFYSISDATAAGATVITFYPVKPTLANYHAVFVNNNILNSFFISAARTVSGSGLHLLTTGLAAYSLSKKNLIFRNKLLLFFILPAYFSGGLLPLYVQIIRLGLYNNFLVYILPGVFGVIHMLIMKVFFEQLPQSLEESARIDGAGDFTIFCRIVIPSSAPIIATILMFIGVAQWNSWFDALLYTNRTELMPLQALLYRIILENQASSIEQILRLSSARVTVTPEAIKMTTLVVTTIPIMIIYPFLQKYFVKGIMIGAVKG